MFVNYKLLKKRIKEMCARSTVSAGVLQPAAVFIRLLRAEMAKVSKIYDVQMRAVSQRIDSLVQGWGRMVGVGAAATRDCRALACTAESKAAALADVGRLHEYAHLNREAVRKIIKKFKKRLQLDLPDAAVDLEPYSFSTDARGNTLLQRLAALEQKASMDPYPVRAEKQRRRMQRFMSEAEIEVEFNETRSRRTRFAGLTLSDLRLWERFVGLFPIVDTVMTSTCERFRGDVAAGLTVGVYALPQSMAYAQLAGLPVAFGLYTAVFPCLVYMAMGSSRHLHVGTYSVVSLAVGSTIQSLGSDTDAPDRAARVAAVLSVLTGVMLCVMGLLRLAFVASLLSDPCLEGFTVAVVVSVIASQLKHMLGVSIPRGTAMQNIIDTCAALGSTHIATLVTAIVAMSVLIALKRASKRIERRTKVPLPAELVLVIVAIVISAACDLQGNFGVRQVGHIPPGLPLPRVPQEITIKLIAEVAGPCVALCLLIFVSGASVSKPFALEHGYEVDDVQELYALGAANVFGGFFQCYPAAGSLSRTALVTSVGGSTSMCSFFSSTVLALVLLVLTGPLGFLPVSVLGAMLAIAVAPLLARAGSLPNLWRHNRSDFCGWVVTFLATLLLGTTMGLGVGFVLCTFELLRQSARAKISKLGVLRGTGLYRPLKRSAAAERVHGVEILELSGSLNFANRATYKDKVLAALWGQGRNYDRERMSDGEDSDGQRPRVLVLVFSMAYQVDTSGVNMLRSVHRTAQAAGVKILLAACGPKVRRALDLMGFGALVSKDKWFVDVASAVHHARGIIQREEKDTVAVSWVRDGDQKPGLSTSEDEKETKDRPIATSEDNGSAAADEKEPRPEGIELKVLNT